MATHFFSISNCGSPVEIAVWVSIDNLLVHLRYEGANIEELTYSSKKSYKDVIEQEELVISLTVTESAEFEANIFRFKH